MLVLNQDIDFDFLLLVFLQLLPEERLFYWKIVFLEIPYLAWPIRVVRNFQGNDCV